MTDPVLKMRIANILGLDADKAQHNVAIEEALHGISNIDDFIAFCRSNRDGIEYVTKTERLDILATKYKKKLFDAEVSKRLDGGKAYADILARKVRETRNIVEEKACLFRDIRKDGERYFKDHELRALAEIGGTWSIIEMSRTGELRDRIFDLYKDKIKDKVRTEKQIAGKQPVKQVASFVEKALGGKA